MANKTLIKKAPSTGFRKRFAELKDGRHCIYTGRMYRKEWRVVSEGRVFFGVDIVSGEILPIPMDAEIVTVETWEIERHLTALSLTCERDSVARRKSLLREVEQTGNVSAACRKYGFSRDSYYRFRKETMRIKKC